MITIHGFKVIAMLPTGRSRDGKPGFVVLVDRTDGHRERYCTALWFEGDREWINGDYTHRLDQAIAFMCSRAAGTSTEVRNGVRESAAEIAHNA